MIRFLTLGSILLCAALATPARSATQLNGFYEAFALMTIVTVAAGIMSVRYNSVLIAVLGIIGGYITGARYG